jgi:carbon-monoxide dehydrogenase medium subunit
MIPAAFDYLLPSDIDETLALLSQHPDATLLAGGHVVLPDMKHRRIRPRLLVDLGHVGELRGIKLDERSATVTIGAMTTSGEIERSAELAARVPLLPRVAAEVSDPLIRNRATIGGSLVQADPRGDWPAIFVASSATVRLRGADGEREVAVEEFLASADTFRGRPGAEGLLVSITLPAHTASTRAVYLKRVHPASGYATLGIAIVAEVKDGVCRACRIGVAGATSHRAQPLERQLIGRELDPEAAQAAAREVVPTLRFVDDVNVSAACRADLFPVYVRRAVAALAAQSPFTVRS